MPDNRDLGIIKPGDVPIRGGLYLLDVVRTVNRASAFPNISDNAEIAELIACGSHVILFSTGRGSVVGSAISPVIKVCANPHTYKRMSDDMDVDAGRILEGRATLDEVGREIYDLIMRVSNGDQTKSEDLGHQEFILTYKDFEPIGPACFLRSLRTENAFTSQSATRKLGQRREWKQSGVRFGSLFCSDVDGESAVSLAEDVPAFRVDPFWPKPLRTIGSSDRSAASRSIAMIMSGSISGRAR